MHETIKLYRQAEHCLREFRLNDSWYVKPKEKDGRGWGATEAIRGALCDDGSLWLADTGHHRLLGWKQCPDTVNSPADLVIGQPDFWHEGRNAKGEVTAQSLNVPTGVAHCGKGLAVADAWNHRVLLWHKRPASSHTPADVVLGQSDFSSAEGNRGNDAPTTLFWPYGVHWDGTRL